MNVSELNLVKFIKLRIIYYIKFILQVYSRNFLMEDVLTYFERRQIAAGVHPAVIGTRTNVILTLILEILLQIAGKLTEQRLKI